MQTGGSRYDKGHAHQRGFRAGRVQKRSVHARARRSRYEDNSQFGHFTSYRVAGAFDATRATRFKASYGTAFKAPSFDSLYFPNFGNPNLNPEKSRGYDAGVLQKLGGGTVELTYYNNKIRDLIGSDLTTFLPVNINRAGTHGFELALDQPLRRDLRLLVSGTTTSVSSSSGRLLRRPNFNASADSDRQPGEVWRRFGCGRAGQTLRFQLRQRVHGARIWRLCAHRFHAVLPSCGPRLGFTRAWATCSTANTRRSRGIRQRALT